MGIEQRVATMSEASKAQLRYIQILKSTTEWQGDMGRTLISPANAIRVLQQQFTLLGRAIGKVFIPIVMKAIPYVMALTQILTDLANRIATLFGYKIADIDYSSVKDMTIDISDGIEDIGDSADSTAKKLQTMLAPFDELNVVQRESEKAGSGVSGLGSDFDLPLPEYDALAGLTDQLSKNVDKAKKDLQDIWDKIQLIGIALGSWKIASSVMDFLDKWNLIDKKSITKTIGLTLLIGSVLLGIKGSLDISEDRWKGIMEQLGASVIGGAGTYMLTKSIGLSLLVTGISSFTYANIDKHKVGSDTDSMIMELLGVAEVAGGTFLITKSLTITLLVTLGFELISIGSSLQEIKDLEPTKEELTYAIQQTLNDMAGPIVNSTFGQSLIDTVLKTFGPMGMILSTILGPFGATLRDIGENILKWFEDLPSNISNFISNIPNIIGNVFDLAKTFVINKVTAITGWFSLLPSNISNFISNIPNIIGNTFNTAKDFVGNKINEIIGWFRDLPSNISNLLSGVPNIIGGIFNTAKDFVGSKIGNIINEVSLIPSKVANAISSIPSIFYNTFNNAKNKVSEVWGKVTSLFSKGGKIFDGLKDGIADVFKSIVNQLIKGINKIIAEPFKKINSLLNNLRSTDVLGIKPFKGLWSKNPLPIPSIPSLYEEGGFPKTGEFFMAREDGPEMVGRIGTRTAVANNDQITTSITNALVTALSGMNFGGGQGTTVVNIGGRKVYEGVGDYIDSENDRYGTNYVRV